MSRNTATLQVPTAPASGTRTASRPTSEVIAFRAHEIFLQRGAAPGLELDDWLQAERELTAAVGQSNSSKKSAPSPVSLASPRSPR